MIFRDVASVSHYSQLKEDKLRKEKKYIRNVQFLNLTLDLAVNNEARIRSVRDSLTTCKETALRHDLSLRLDFKPIY